MMDSRKKIIFAGTAAFAVPALEKLFENKDIEIVLVLTQPRKPAGRGLKETMSAVDACAQNLGLPVLHPETLRKSVFEETLKGYPCDFLVVAAYGKIVPQWMLDWPRVIALNIHGSLLPRWRGASPIQHALLHGDVATGVGIMEMTAGLDEGPVFLEKEIRIEKNDNQSSLTDKLGKIGANALIHVLSDFESLRPKAQTGEATYAPKITKEHGLIDWSLPAEKIIQQFKALSPWPSLYSFDENKQRVKFCEIGLDVIAQYDISPGSVKISPTSLFVGTGDGAVEVLSLQWEGKKALSIAEGLKTKHPYLSHLLKFQ